MKVTLAYPYTDADGKTTEADKTVELPEDVARHLLHFGRARPADEPATEPAPTSKPSRATKATTAATRKA